MPSVEPLEASFARPPALSNEQEEQFREMGVENLEDDALSRSLSRATTHLDRVPTTLRETVEDYEKQGFKIVEFEAGKGEDPREFSKFNKWYITFCTAFLCTAAALGSSIVTGDMRGPVEDMHTSQEIVNLTVTCFVIGFGIGPLWFAPLSEIYGRRPIYCISIFGLFIFTLPSALAKNSATLVVGRMLAGLAASAPICNVGGSMADIWAVEERGIPMAAFSFAIFLGPVLGPLVGGFIGENAGWRWIYWVLFIFSGACFVFTLFIPETLASTLLKRKAQKLRKDTGDKSYRTLEELDHRTFSETLKVALFRPLVMLFTEPIVFYMTCYLSFIYSILYLLFFAFPIAFVDVRGWSDGITGVTFISIMLGIILAMCLMPFQERIYASVTKNGHYPEARLYPSMLGAILLPIALFIFAFTGAYAWVHWMGVCVAGFLFGFALIIVYISANSYIVDSYSSYAASAIAAKTLMRSIIGAMVPLYVNQMFKNMGFQYAGLLLACLGLLIAPIPYVFFFYGHRIRARSAKATKLTRIRDEDVETKEKNLECL